MGFSPALPLLLAALQAPKKKVAAAPAAVRAAKAPKAPTNPLYEKRPRTFGALFISAAAAAAAATE